MLQITSPIFYNVIAVTKRYGAPSYSKEGDKLRLIIIALKTRSFAKLSINRQHIVPTKNLRFSNYGELQGKDEVIFIILNPPE